MRSTEKESKTNFGFKEVPLSTKERLVNKVFSSVANKYDIMNDVMSLGMHRLWKKEFMKFLPDKSKSLLDLASGTGDIAYNYFTSARQAAESPRIIVSDINKDMLEVARAKFIDAGILNVPISKFADVEEFEEDEERKTTVYNSLQEDSSTEPTYKLPTAVEFLLASAMDLPFKDNAFDYCTIAFGIRNVADIEKALSEALRVLKPGGKFVCMELSPLKSGIISEIYDIYSFKIIPKIGRLIADDEESYQYLVESIRKFPKPRDFANLIEKAGFKCVNYKSMNFETVSIHYGYK